MSVPNPEFAFITAIFKFTQKRQTDRTFKIRVRFLHSGYKPIQAISNYLSSKAQFRNFNPNPTAFSKPKVCVLNVSGTDFDLIQKRAAYANRSNTARISKQLLCDFVTAIGFMKHNCHPWSWRISLVWISLFHVFTPSKEIYCFLVILNACLHNHRMIQTCFE